MKIIPKEEAKEIIKKINYITIFPGEKNIILGKDDCKKLMKYIEYLQYIEYQDDHKYDEVFIDEIFDTGEEDGDNNG